jgi:hypothetical protein
MADVTFKSSRSGIKSILNSPGTIKAVDERAEAIRSRAASMYSAYGYGRKPARAGYGSAHAVVFTASRFAKWENRRKMTLSKAWRVFQ